MMCLILVAVLNHKTSIVPDYFVKETHEWIVFPHEINGLSKDEIAKGKTDLSNIQDIL